MFERAAAFNGDLSGWDVRNVTDMSAMFWDAAAFNGDLSGWDVRNVTNMSGMFWRRGLQRRPERLGRAQRHGHGKHVPKHAGAEPQARVVHRKRLRRLGWWVRWCVRVCVSCACAQ